MKKHVSILGYVLLAACVGACSDDPSGSGPSSSAGAAGSPPAASATAGRAGAAGTGLSTGFPAGATGGAAGRPPSLPIAGSGGSGAAPAGRAAAGSGGPIAGRAAAAGMGGVAGSAGAAAPSGSIWMPKPGTTWQWQLTGKLDTSVDAAMYDIDLFTSSAADLQVLHGAGRIVVCYFSAGSYEPDRPDSDALSQTGLGKTLDGWPDEKWLDIRSAKVRELMEGRLDLAKSHGCDGVEPDNVDGFDNDNGLGLSEADQLDYDRFLAGAAHARGLSIGLKNSLALVSELVGSFDWALNEECLQYEECDALQPFLSAGKAVFHCEYGTSTSGICDAVPKGFSTIVKNLDLDAARMACP